MEEWYNQLIAFLCTQLPGGKESAKSVFFSNGFGPVWDVARDYVFSYRVWLLGLLPSLLLERWRPAVPTNATQRASLKLDMLYPVLAGLLAMPFVNVFVAGITNFYHQTLPFLNTGLLTNKPLWLQMIGAFLIADLVLYASHVARHKIRWAWYFHTIHHSQESLNPMTTHRVHFGEKVINALLRTAPIAFVGGSEITWTVFVVLNNFWGYFIHANIRSNLGPLRFLLVTPQFHRVHHSTHDAHADRNYGERLIIWDWLFGTLVDDFDCYPTTGVKSVERWMIETDRSPQSLVTMWFKQSIYPFYKIAREIRNGITKAETVTSP